MAQANKADDPSVEIEGFLNSLFEGLEGYIYTPTKDIESGYWQQYWHKWPEKKQAAITHLLAQSSDKDCYVAPSIFKAPSDKKQAWKGSNYVWIEFDGNAPKNTPDGIPNPTIRIQSSVSKHEHWYWKLSETTTDRNTLEGLTKSLAYTLDADLSGWDCSQVLRPPGTIHQESKRRVRLLSQNGSGYGFRDFKDLVTPPEPAVLGTTFDELPDVQAVVAKYKWPDDAVKLFGKKTQPIGSRSSAMTRLGLHCIEMGMSNEECYAVLYNADERWGKFKNRAPDKRAERLIGIITYCRGKKELDAQLHISDQFEPFVSLKDFLSSTPKARWIYKDLLIERGLGVISALPGVGKSTFSLRMAISMALGRKFLKWEYVGKPEGLRVGFMSLEMLPDELRELFDKMLPSLSDKDRVKFTNNFVIYPSGSAFNLAGKKEQQHVLDYIDKFELDVLIIDSLKAATRLDEKRIDDFFDWLNKHVRNNRGCACWLVHHNRKPPNEGPRKPRGLEDLYGDTFIGAHPTVVLGLWGRSKGVLEVLYLKVRLAEEADPFTIKRTRDLDFRVEGSVEDKEEEKEKGLDNVLNRPVK